MTNHTPGPWSVVAADGCFIVETSESYIQFFINGSNRDGDEANARLIAAAPEMLEELRACEAHLHAYIKAIEFGGGSASKSAGRLASVRSAIAKATGETE